MSTAVITPATSLDRTECADVLARAFADDPFTLLLVPEGPERHERLAAVLGAETESTPMAPRVVDVARDPQTSAIVGLAVWEPPATDRAGGRRARLASLPGTLRHAAAGVRASGLRGAPAAARTLRSLAQVRPRTPHWYLLDLAVAPEAGGRGVGGALLRHGLDRADADHAPAYLESTTPGSRRLYARHGFTERTRLDLTGDGYPATMWRGAAPARGDAAR